MNNQISVKDLELLSSFLDNQLSPSEMKQVQSRLAEDADLQAALSGLRRTRIILSALPTRKVPRNFTLPPQVKKNRFDLYQYFRVFRFSSAAAVLCFLVVFFLNFLMPSLGFGTSSAARVVLATAAVTTVEPAGKPMIITWTTPLPSGFGRGGVGGGAADTAIPEATPQALQAPAPMPNAKIAPGEPMATPAASEVQPMSVETPAPITGTGPILGVPPIEERGATPTITVPVQNAGQGIQGALRILEIGFALIAIATAVIAFVLRKKLP
jgi:hypothetical protein